MVEEGWILAADYITAHQTANNRAKIRGFKRSLLVSKHFTWQLAPFQLTELDQPPNAAHLRTLPRDAAS